MRERATKSSQFIAPFRLPKALEWLLALVVALELIAPFFAKSYGVDGPSQLNLIGQFSRLVSSGVLFPRWAPGGVFGFGIGSFYFYPPVAFYLSSIVRLVTGSGNVEFLYQMTGLIATVLSFFAARPLLRELGASNYDKNLGALLYAFAPLRIAEIYSRSSISSHVAYIFVPLVWFGLVAIVRGNSGDRVKYIMALGISAALLALSSVPLSLATGLCIGVAAIATWRIVTFRVVLDVACAGVLAALLSMFHFSAVLTAMPYAQLSDLTVFNPEFILTNLLHWNNVPAIYHIGILYLSWAILCAVYWWPRTKGWELSDSEKMILRIAVSIGIFIALLEIPPLSRPLWGMIQPFKLIQGCWRFYIHFVLMGTVVVAIASTPRMKLAARAICWVWIVGAIGPALLVIFNLHLYSHGNGPGGDPTEYLPIYTIHAQTEGFGQLKNRASDPAVIADFHQGERIVVNAPVRESQTDSIHLYGSRLATFHRFYWPYWHLYTDGNEIPSRPDPLGRATATLPAGDYTAKWRLIRSPLEWAGFWISGLTALGMLGFWASRYWPQHIRKGSKI